MSTRMRKQRSACRLTLWGLLLLIFVAGILPLVRLLVVVGPGGMLRATDTCHSEEAAEYDGETVVRSGADLATDTAAECCQQCAQAKLCNVWVWCGEAECEGGRTFGECWLKHKEGLDPLYPVGRRGTASGWTSGARYSAAQEARARERASKGAAKEQAYLDALRNNKALPLVYFDIAIKDRPVGRIEFVLFSDVAPRAAENFRQLTTGEAGVVPKGREGAGKAYHFLNAPFYRIIDQFIDQAGVDVESVFGGMFKDDPGGLKLKHVHKGLLSMANMGPNTNTAHFSIMMAPAPHLDGSYTIFGQVVAGFDVVDAINKLSVDQPDHTATAEAGVRIAGCGQLRQGTILPDLQLDSRR